MSNPRSGAPKRVAAGLLVGALSVFGLALAPSAGATATVTTERFGGTDRYDTAKLISEDEAFAAPKTAIVATGQNFPDALAASTLAGTLRPAPIILTATASLSPQASAALTALKGKGVTAVHIAGGTVAVSQATEDAIKALGLTVTRQQGTGSAANRYGTAAQIAKSANAITPTGSIAGLKAAFIATGLNFADAVSAAPGAYAARIPVLLVNNDVPAETTDAITALGIKKAYVLGGTAAVNDAIVTKLTAQTGNPVTRIQGTTATGSSQDRFGTAAAIADFAVSTLGFANPTAAIIANGTDAKQGVDALASGPLGGEVKAPVLLVSNTVPLPEPTRFWLDKSSPTVGKIYVAGGTEVIDAAVVAAAVAAAQTVNNDSAAKAVTTRPELTGAAIVSTTTATQVTPGNPAGTKVRYTFDEALGTAFLPNPARFKLYNSSGALADTADTATIETGTGTTGTTVLVNFPNLATTASTASLSKATVVFEAVRDVGGAGNPEGDAPIGTAGTTPAAAGTTAAPDLVSVGGFRQASQIGATAIDFTFDQAAQVQSTTAFHIVDVNGNDPVCVAPANGTTTTGGGSVAGGNGTTVITVTCTNVGGTLGIVAGTAYSAGNVARGYVTAGGVGTTVAGANPNPLQAADVAGSSLGPDLVSVALSTTAPTTTAVFTFDQAISNATAAAFALYNAAGSTIGSGTGATVSSTDARQVAVTFASVTGAIGGNVTGNGTQAGNGAVRGTDGTYNNPDEEGFAGSASTLTPGRTSAPDLTAVAITAIADSFGNTSGYSAVYTFDSTAAQTLTLNSQTAFHLYLADGTRFNSTTCATGNGGAGSTAQGTVRCTVYVNHLTGAAPATATTLQGAVLGTVEAGAVNDPGAPTNSSSEGAAATTGGTGTPAS